MRRTIVLALAGALVLAQTAPARAGDAPTSTSAPTTSTTTTTAPPASTTAPPASSTTTAPGATTTTTGPDASTSTTTNPDDPVGEVDAPPEAVPVVDATVPPAPGEVVDGRAATRIIRRELRVAKAEALQSQADVDAAATRVDALSERLATLQRELARLDVVQEQTVLRLEAAEERFRERVANAVVRGNAAELDTIISSEDANEVLTRKMFLTSVTEADSAAVAELVAAKEVVDAGVLEAVEAVDATRHELRDARAQLEEVLEVNAERRFALAVFAAGSEILIRGFVFPVGEPYTFGDSWGFPRMVGTEYEHGHQGTDIMAPFDTPLYAVERGIISSMGTDVLGGTKLWLKGQSGTYYYYAHLSAYAEGIASGTLVEAGDIIGFVGDTGNARGGAPHLHFQVHPGGGDAVNPYGLLRVVADLSRR